jgi:hypothetical protein
MQHEKEFHLSTLAMTDQEREAFLQEPHIAVISVANDAGRPPHSAPVWYHYEPNGNVTFFTGTQGRVARKTALIEQAGVVSFVIQREEFPYKYVAAECTVVHADRPPSEESIFSIVRRYLPEEAARGFAQAELANPGPDFVLFTLKPVRWFTNDFGKLERR